MLRAQMTVKASKEAPYNAVKEELDRIILAKAQTFVASLAAHLAGCIAGSSRFAGILGIPPPKP